MDAPPTTKNERPGYEQLGYEFFLCSHRATRDGLVPKSMAEIARRVIIIEIGASKFSGGKASGGQQGAGDDDL